MRALRCLDLFSGAGGASYGLHLAGFEVWGVDINPQSRYPWPERFIQADALTYPLDGFDLVWASPPCQAHSTLNALWGRDYPDHIPAMRERLQAWGGPWIIENVPGAPLHNTITLCGTHFGLKVYRHRLFESNLMLFAPSVHQQHKERAPKAGRPPQPGQFITPVGHFSGVAYAQEAMGIPWMGQKELAQAIPPAYSFFLGTQVIEQLRRAA